jgi:hypothetical protein
MTLVRRLCTDKIIVPGVMVIVWDEICPTAIAVSVGVVGEERQEDCGEANDTRCLDKACARGGGHDGGGSCARCHCSDFFLLSLCPCVDAGVRSLLSVCFLSPNVCEGKLVGVRERN